MIVNGKEYRVEDLVKSIDFTANSFQKVGNLMLTKREIDILKRNLIEYETCSSLKDLMIKIEVVLEDELYNPDNTDELEYVLESISERNYYENTRK